MATKKITKQKKRTHTHPFTLLVAVSDTGEVYTSGAIEHKNGKTPSDETLRCEIENLLYDVAADGSPVEIKGFVFDGVKIPEQKIPEMERKTISRWNREVVFVDRTTDEGRKLSNKQTKAFREDAKAAKPKTTKKR